MLDTSKCVGLHGQNVLGRHQNQWSIEVGDAWIFSGIETRLTFKPTTAINLQT